MCILLTIYDQVDILRSEFLNVTDYRFLKNLYVSEVSDFSIILPHF